MTQQPEDEGPSAYTRLVMQKLADRIDAYLAEQEARPTDAGTGSRPARNSNAMTPRYED